MRLNLDDILIDKFAVRNGQSVDCVNHIDLAILIIIGYIIEKDVLSAIVSLIDQKWLATMFLVSCLGPSLPVILNAHRSSLLKSLKDGDILIDGVLVVENVSFLNLSLIEIVH